MPRPQRPNPELIQQYSLRFAAQGAGGSDRALTELFRVFPDNVQIEHVLLKVVTLNSLYYTGILAVGRAAEHIWRCNIDPKLAQRVPELVNEIAAMPMKEGKIRWNFSFASKYCSWHVSDAYPIYDSYVDRLICEYQRSDKFSDFKQQDLRRDYRRYKRVIEDFRTYYGLADYSYKELDKFLWLYGKEYFGR